jgi:asparagine synthase (glutamine-hydrolysing)
MCTSDRRYWIVFNGEIYNYIELREDLRKQGYCFESQSDTEVILAAFQAWGTQCLDRFNGMFAMLLFDRSEGKLLAARDRFGIKPLYYWVSPLGELAFASEIKQFTVLPGWAAEINGQRAYDYLAWGLTDHTHETLFSGVFQVRPGTLLEVNVSESPAGQSRSAPGRPLPTSQWYTLTPRPFTGSFEDAAEQFRDIFTQAVCLRLRSDVPVGSCLSGGIDSSSIVCTMERLLAAGGDNGAQRTFSACADVERYDERRFIDEVVRATRVEARYVYPSLPDLFAVLDRISWHQDEPFGSTSIFAQWCVFRLAAESGVTVMLDGQGSDEQLAGYHSFFAPRLTGLLKRREFAQLDAELRAVKQLHGIRGPAALKLIMSMLLPRAIRPLARRVASRTPVSPTWLNAPRLGAAPEDPYARRGAITDSVEALSHAQLTSTNLQMLLHWEDRNSMAHSIEARLPFLDFNLVEFALGLPEEYKLALGMTKRVLREAMRGVLPESIRQRTDKLGFVTPEEVWLREREPRAFESLLKGAISNSAGVLNASLLTKFERIVSGDEPFSFVVWRAISFASWMKTFHVNLQH